MLKQAEIDASKIKRVKTSRSLISGIEKSKRDKYKTKQTKNVERKLMRVETTDILNKIEYESEQERSHEKNKKLKYEQKSNRRNEK